ncbi:MAG: phosphodiester glycosidase family protein, partial [Candidatus Omnitrophota bacterium]
MFDKDMPAMPKWVNLPTLTTMIPVGGNESIIYNFKEIDEVLDTGYTVLTYLIDHHKGEWENFIARMQREGKADESELQLMRDLKFGEQLGNVNAELEMQIRLWVSYRFQPFARTLNGLMHYVQALRLYAQIEHPDWSEEKIRGEVNRKYQLLWGAQGYGDQLANNDPKAEGTRYLAEMAYKLYGFIIDIAYIQKRDGVFYSVLARYNPASGKIEDVIANKLTAEWPLASEGKPGNQTHALRYVRSERTMTIDINQDYYVEQALKIPHLLTVFRDRNLDLVGYPEDIFTEDYSLIGKFHAIADRTFNALVQPVLFLLGARFHYGHPDVWRTSAIRQIGGVSRSFPVNEDIFGGYELTLRGRKIGYVMWIEAGKAREVSWATTDGIFRKFGMGATQQAYNRYLYYLNSSKNFNILQQLTHLYGGIGYYLRKPWVIAGLFAYLGFMLIGGVSGFAAFPAELLFAVFGIVLFAQSITFTGYAQYIIDNPTIRGTLEFWFKIFPLMSPFFMAHVFTNSAGVNSAQKGIATYVATGRGFMLSHLGIDQVYNNFAKSHIIPGAIGTAMAVYGMLLWQNITLIFSLPYVAIVFFAIVVPIISSRGSAPIFKVKMSNYASILKKDATKGLSKIISSSFHKVFPTKVSFANPINWLRAVRETGNVAIFVTSWALITALGFIAGVLALPFSARATTTTSKPQLPKKPGMTVDFLGLNNMFNRLTYIINRYIVYPIRLARWEQVNMPLNKAQGEADNEGRGAEKALPVQPADNTGNTGPLGANVTTRTSTEEAGGLGVDMAAPVSTEGVEVFGQHERILRNGIGVNSNPRSPPAGVADSNGALGIGVTRSAPDKLVGAVVANVTSSEALDSVRLADAQSATSGDGERGQNAEKAAQRAVAKTGSESRSGSIIGSTIARIFDRIGGWVSAGLNAGAVVIKAARARLNGAADEAKKSQIEGSIRASGFSSRFNKVFIFSLAVFLTPLTALAGNGRQFTGDFKLLVAGLLVTAAVILAKPLFKANFVKFAKRVAVLTLAGVLYLGVAFVHDGSFGLRHSIVEASSVGYSRTATKDYISPAGYFMGNGRPAALIIENGNILNPLNTQARVRGGALFVVANNGRSFVTRIVVNKDGLNDLSLTLGAWDLTVRDVRIGIQAGPMAIEAGRVTEDAKKYRERGAKNIVFVDSNGNIGFISQRSWTLGRRGVSAERLAQEAVNRGAMAGMFVDGGSTGRIYKPAAGVFTREPVVPQSNAGKSGTGFPLASMAVIPLLGVFGFGKRKNEKTDRVTENKSARRNVSEKDLDTIINKFDAVISGMVKELASERLAQRKAGMFITDYLLHGKVETNNQALLELAKDIGALSNEDLAKLSTDPALAFLSAVVAVKAETKA